MAFRLAQEQSVETFMEWVFFLWLNSLIQVLHYQMQCRIKEDTFGSIVYNLKFYYVQAWQGTVKKNLHTNIPTSVSLYSHKYCILHFTNLVLTIGIHIFWLNFKSYVFCTECKKSVYFHASALIPRLFSNFCHVIMTLSVFT